MRSISRRAVLGTSLALPLGHAIHARASAQREAPLAFDLDNLDLQHQFDPGHFNVAGVYDFDWLLASEFERMLDLIASSPGAIGAVRAFGIFTMGEREDLQPGTGGVVWDDATLAPDFTLPFEALHALTSRGLTPFIALGFFPPAVSPSPIAPPATFETWQALIRSFFQELIGDERFGESAIANWHFEVWNEPNEGRFWSGSFEQYLDLYRATSEVVTELGLNIRLGGPAMAYKPESEAEDGPETMSRFLRFLQSEPAIRCDFISYHRKGTVDSSAPDPRRLYDAAIEINELIETIVPDRAAGLTLINNEADEKIGFEVPYLPRMDHFAASWLTTLVTTHAALSIEHTRPFWAVQDNANLQLMQTPFDGRRSIYSFLDTADRSDLVKLSGAIWYDLLPLLRGSVVSPRYTQPLFPATDLHAVCVSSESSVAFLVTWYPREDATGQKKPVDVALFNLDWPAVNITQWRIDATHSNAFAIANSLGSPEAGNFTLEDAAVIRGGQELALEYPVRSNVAMSDTTFTASFAVEPFDTVCLWITPTVDASIAAPTSATATILDSGFEISWSPVIDDQLVGYEIAREGSVVAGPLRPCLWIDTIAPGGSAYTIRAVSASGSVSEWTAAVTG